MKISQILLYFFNLIQGNDADVENVKIMTKYFAVGETKMFRNQEHVIQQF